MTFGVVPNRPETGYGYLELGDMVTGDAYTVEKFHEKPDSIAQEMIDLRITYGMQVFSCFAFSFVNAC